MKITAIIAAAGKGERAKLGKNKVLELLNGKTVLEMAVTPFDENEQIDDIIIIAAKEDFEVIGKIAENFKKPIKLVEGGETRTYSVLNALNSCDCDVVLIHDGARPYIDGATISRCIESVLKYGSGITCVPCVDTLGDVENEQIVSTHRLDNCIIQTPQGFLLNEILHVYSFITNEDLFTDDAGVYCKYLRPAQPVIGSRNNVKLTFFEDFQKTRTLCGTGFDLHRLTPGRKLILGGIEIPHDKGLLGHSDADVLTHAIMDSLLSAAGLSDIGTYFSDQDPQYKDISSMILLDRVLTLIKAQNIELINVTAVIMAEKPKLAPYVKDIRTSLSRALSLPFECVGITCTTLEGLGIVGEEKGIACQAYCSVIKL